MPKGDPDMSMDDRMNFLLFLLRHQHRRHASSLGTWAISPDATGLKWVMSALSQTLRSPTSMWGLG